MKQSAAPTMKDVAREAGVSLGTVSKVINGIPVGESYRLRVERAAQRLGYMVNNYARGLKTNRTNCVALLLPSLRHPFFAALADEVVACLTRRGYRCILMITNFDPEAEHKCFVMVRQNKADGILALTYSARLTVDENLPIVSFDRHLGNTIPCVSSDNYRGGELAAEKLLELGSRRLLSLHIVADVQGEAHKRAAGFTDYCRRAGADCTSIILKDEDTEDPFYSYMTQHLRGSRPDFDGIFCSSDDVLLRVRSFLESKGVRVPEDVQLIGYDGVPDYATGRCLCSTIEQPVGRMAAAAVGLLLDRDNTDKTGLSLCLPVRYIWGGTTRAAKS